MCWGDPRPLPSIVSTSPNGRSGRRHPPRISGLPSTLPAADRPAHARRGAAHGRARLHRGARPHRALARRPPAHVPPRHSEDAAGGAGPAGGGGGGNRGTGGRTVEKIQFVRVSPTPVPTPSTLPPVVPPPPN